MDSVDFSQLHESHNKYEYKDSKKKKKKELDIFNLKK